MVKTASVLNIELKPANAPAPVVSALFSKYNDEVMQAVSVALKQVYGYFQERLADKLTEAGETLPE